jgi:hypothetical protein
VAGGSSLGDSATAPGDPAGSSNTGASAPGASMAGAIRSARVAVTDGSTPQAVAIDAIATAHAHVRKIATRRLYG